MEILRQEPQETLPCSRGFTATMTIRSFKGRKDVVVHLFRPYQDPGDGDNYNWTQLIDHSQDANSERSDSREVILESFTKEELEQIVQYLHSRYADRLVEIRTNALRYPLPMGLVPLKAMPEGKDMGRIRFEIVPNYPLSFIMHGFYDLSQHKPLA
ncbi:MAG: hypothetical protein RBR42_10785 [Desulfomicrobium sp.]|jgi:hypothetical protein|nr:hypothetical protein [Desulfomicrobium sp.]NLV97614.1 hypothetical protein [Desulfovibrionales bacterium]